LTVPLGDLPPGILLVRLVGSQGDVFTGKIPCTH
jgi:hypothetical protein